MSAHTPRERWLWGATLASGLVVALCHTGGPVACATTVQDVETRTVRTPLSPWQVPELILTKQTSPMMMPSVERIQRGSFIEVTRFRGAPGERVSEGAFAGFDPAAARILITPDGEAIESVPCDQIEVITVIGESPTAAHVGNGALIGGFTGVAIGALAGAGVGGRDYGAVCAAGFAIPAGLVGTGIGAGVGAGASPGRARTRYWLNPNGWRIHTPVQTSEVRR